MKLEPDEIYRAALSAGFSPDQATTMTAIALAESGGETTAHNSSGEDSKGLWQINMNDHRDVVIDGVPFGELDPSNPVVNAKMAWIVSRGGVDITRWSVTHTDDGNANYLGFRDEATRAAALNGYPDARGQWNAPYDYHSKGFGAGSDAFPEGFVAPSGDFPTGQGSAGGGDGVTRFDVFMHLALAQQGDEYDWAYEADPNDPDPDRFDCSELIEWAAARAGVDVVDGSWNQFTQIHQSNTTMSVEEALQTKGAILFRFSTDPLAGVPPDDGRHVAISLGDGRVMEARGTGKGVGIFSAEGRTWTHAGYFAELGTEDGSPLATGEALQNFAMAGGQTDDAVLDPRDLDGDLVFDRLEAWLDGVEYSPEDYLPSGATMPGEENPASPSGEITQRVLRSEVAPRAQNDRTPNPSLEGAANTADEAGAALDGDNGTNVNEDSGANVGEGAGATLNDESGIDLGGGAGESEGGPTAIERVDLGAMEDELAEGMRSRALSSTHEFDDLTGRGSGDFDFDLFDDDDDDDD